MSSRIQSELSVMITGANRGLGLEFVRQYLGAGARVIATCRKPAQADQLQALREAHKGLHVIALDVGDAISIINLKRELDALSLSIDVLIHNAGVYPTKTTPEHVGTFDFDTALDVFRINALASLMVTQATIHALSKHAKIVAIASDYASITHNTKGFPYYYAASKAAQNMLMRSLAVELSEHIVLCLDPGWVRTDMGGPEAPLSPSQSIAGMLQVIHAATHAQSGTFLTWRGRPQAW